MDDFYVKIGDESRFTKTVSESDVYMFAGIPEIFRQTMSINPIWKNRPMAG